MQRSHSTLIRAAVAAFAVLAIGVGILAATGGEEPGPLGAPSSAIDAAPTAEPATLWAVGDGANGSRRADGVVAMIEEADPDRLIYLGDVYEDGTAEEFERNYAPSWGRLAGITLPTPGNHDWPQHDQGYDPYWSGLTGGKRPPDHYAVEVGGWELLSLNSEEPVGAGSEQYRWLQRELDGVRGDCRILFTHRPRFSAGDVHNDQPDLASLFRLLGGKAKVYLAGHEHNMQQLAPTAGITTLISGAAGQEHYGILPESESRLEFSDTESDGALELKLEPGRADWRFVSVGGEELHSGGVDCRGG